MNIAELKAMPSLDSIISDIERYGLAQNAVELMTYGFTVVSPETLGVADAWIERLRYAAVAAYEKRNNVSVDFRTSTITALLSDAFYDEDEVFIEASDQPSEVGAGPPDAGPGRGAQDQLDHPKGHRHRRHLPPAPAAHRQRCRRHPDGRRPDLSQAELFLDLHRLHRRSRRPDPVRPRQPTLRPQRLAPRQRRHQHTLSDRAPRGRGRLGGDVARGHVPQHFAAHPDWAASNAERELHPPLHSGPPRQTLHSTLQEQWMRGWPPNAGEQGDVPPLPSRAGLHPGRGRDGEFWSEVLRCPRDFLGLRFS